MAPTPHVSGSPTRATQSEESDAMLALSTAVTKITGKRQRVDAEQVISALADKYEEHQCELNEGSGVAAKEILEYLRHLNDGNYTFKNTSDPDDALKCLNASIAHAVAGSRTLLFAYERRALVLQKMRDYDAAVADLDRALLSNPSSEMKQELEDRKAQCLQAKAEVETASTQQHSGPQPSPQPSLTDSESFTGSVDGTEGQWSSLLELANPHTPNPFPRIRYAYDTKRGQYLEAAEDIEPGQLIISDKYWTVRLEDEFKYEYCSYCFKRCLTLIPCPSCAREMYCGETCQNEASDSYHRLECKITNKVSSWGFLETMLTRMILVSTGQGKRLNDLMKTVKAREIFSPGFCASEAFGIAYPRLLRLRTEYNRKMINEYVSTAARIIVRLERVGFFGESSNSESPPTRSARYQQRTLTEAQAFTGILLLNYATALKTHSLELVSYGSRLTTIQNRRMGVGVTALPSVLRHSCLPNAHSLNRHRNLVIFAGRPIKKGEEILVSSIKNAHYPDDPLRERLVQVFMRHGYVCKCEACANNLPTLEQLKNSRLRFLNYDESGIARQEFLKFAKPILGNKSSALDMRSLLRIAFACRDWVDKYVVTPSYDGFLGQQLLFGCMQHSYDDFCQEVAVDDGRMLVRTCLSKIASRAEIDLAFISVFDKKNLKRFLNQ